MHIARSRAASTPICRVPTKDTLWERGTLLARVVPVPSLSSSDKQDQKLYQSKGCDGPSPSPRGLSPVALAGGQGVRGVGSPAGGSTAAGASKGLQPYVWHKGHQAGIGQLRAASLNLCQHTIAAPLGLGVSARWWPPWSPQLLHPAPHPKYTMLMDSLEK